MLSEEKVTKYLKAKDLDDKKQLQKGLNTMIKQKNGKESPHTRVYDITTAFIR
jgi:hypothetical protein